MQCSVECFIQFLVLLFLFAETMCNQIYFVKATCLIQVAAIDFEKELN